MKIVQKHFSGKAKYVNIFFFTKVVCSICPKLLIFLTIFLICTKKLFYAQKIV